MAPDLMDQILKEFVASRESSGDAMLDAVQAALFLEDVFGVLLADADITPELLGSQHAIRQTLVRLQGAG
ncbi:MAG TPA: hypothetical protein PLB21_00630 [Actinomycetota bacterium]|nr:hypothetical protein [Actinomycetota bacterium]